MKTYQLTPTGAQSLPLIAKTLDEASHVLPQGLYTTFRTYANGARVLGLQAHLDRLYQPAAHQNIHPALSEAELRLLLAEICANAQGESRLRLTLDVTRSPGALFLTLQPFTPLAPEIYQNGVQVLTAEQTRRTPRLKSTAFIETSADLRLRVTGSIFEALLCHEGSLLEGMTSNFYSVQAQRLVTSRYGILLGVTRRAVIRLARQIGLEVEYRAPDLAEIFGGEAFLSSSSRGIVPIVWVDGRPVGQGCPGPWTKKLIVAYNAYVEKSAQAW
jgi:branched-chain amino acid aminotransferase